MLEPSLIVFGSVRCWHDYKLRLRLRLHEISAVRVHLNRIPGGYLQITRSGVLDFTSSLEAKFWARSGQVHQIRGKTWEVLSSQDAKVGKKSQLIWGHI